MWLRNSVCITLYLFYGPQNSKPTTLHAKCNLSERGPIKRAHASKAKKDYWWEGLIIKPLHDIMGPVGSCMVQIKQRPNRVRAFKEWSEGTVPILWTYYNSLPLAEPSGMTKKRVVSTVTQNLLYRFLCVHIYSNQSIISRFIVLRLGQ